MKKINVVGAGIGALHLGIRLQYVGFQVTLFEKNAFPGGVVHHIQYGPYLFDATASIMISPKEYSKIFSDCHRNAEDYYSTLPLSETFRVFPKQDLPFSLPSDLESLVQKVTTCFPQSAKGYFHFLKQTRLRYSRAQKYLLRRLLKGPISLLSPKLLYHTYRLHTFSTAATYLKTLIPDEPLRDSLLFQTLFMGYTPYSVPNIYTAIPAVVQLDGLCHIQGGLSTYTSALVQLFHELGGTLKLNTPVEQILFKNNQPVGIQTKKKIYYSDAVVVGTDYRYASTKLIPPAIRKQLMGSLRFKSLTSSIGVIILRLVVDQPLCQLGVHNLLLPSDFKAAMAQTFGGAIPEDPPIYVYYPAAVDTTFQTNEGHVCFHAMVRVPHLGDLDPHDAHCFDRLKNTVLQRLGQVTGLTDFSSHVVMTDLVTPYDFWRDYHYTDGCAFGLAHTFCQSMALRPQVTVPSVPNLYFVGCNIHPGNGLSIVLDSAKLAADHLCSVLGQAH